MRKISLTQVKENQKGIILDISGGPVLQNKFILGQYSDEFA